MLCNALLSVSRIAMKSNDINKNLKIFEYKLNKKRMKEFKVVPKTEKKRKQRIYYV